MPNLHGFVNYLFVDPFSNIVSQNHSQPRDYLMFLRPYTLVTELVPKATSIFLATPLPPAN